MKKILINLIILCFATISNGQIIDQAIYHSYEGTIKEDRAYFIDNNLKTTSAYYFKINKRGKAKKDSILLYQKTYDKEQNKVFGTVSETNFSTGFGSYLSWEDFEAYYNDDGLMIKYITKTAQNKVERVARYDEDYSIKIKEYEYDSLNNLTKSKNYKHWYNLIGEGDFYNERLNISESKYDSLQKIIENSYYSCYLSSLWEEGESSLFSNEKFGFTDYVYGSNGQILRIYNTKADEKDINIESYQPNPLSCAYPKYLSLEYKYNSKNKILEKTSYKTNGDIYRKWNYSYDDDLRIIKETDSVGWYGSPVYLKSVTTFEYTETGEIETDISYDKFMNSTSMTIYFYNNDNRLIKTCRSNTSSGSQKCTEYKHIEKSDNSSIDLTIYSDGTIKKEEYQYKKDERGFITESKIIVNGKLTELIHYYYK